MSKIGWLSLFDADEIKRLEELAGAKTLKRHWIKEGYSQQMSLYGVVTNREVDESGYKRIEILSNTNYTEKIIHLVYYFFRYFKPEAPYTIWLYDKDLESIKEIGAYP